MKGFALTAAHINNFTIVRNTAMLSNLGPIWVRLAGSTYSLKDEERAVSTVEIQSATAEAEGSSPVAPAIQESLVPVCRLRGDLTLTKEVARKNRGTTILSVLF